VVAAARALRLTARANPYPEVKDPICRLPLPTLFYLARGFSPWAPDAVIGTDKPMLNRCPPEAGGAAGATRSPVLVGAPSSCCCLFKAPSGIRNGQNEVRSSAREPPSPHDLIPGARLSGAAGHSEENPPHRALKRKDNSPSDPNSGRQPTVGPHKAGAPRANCCHNIDCGHGILTVFPFGASGCQQRPASSVSRLRTDSPEAKYSYFGNLALFGL